MKDIIMFAFMFVIMLGGGVCFIGDCFFQRKKRKACTEKMMAKYKTCKTVTSMNKYYMSKRYIPCFSYEYEGQEFNSLAIGSGLTMKKIMKYRYDEQYEVYIDPANPQSLRLNTGGIGGEIARFLVGSFLIIFALFLALLCIAGLSYK